MRSLKLTGETDTRAVDQDAICKVFVNLRPLDTVSLFIKKIKLESDRSFFR